MTKSNQVHKAWNHLNLKVISVLARQIFKQKLYNFPTWDKTNGSSSFAFIIIRHVNEINGYCLFLPPNSKILVYTVNQYAKQKEMKKKNLAFKWKKKKMQYIEARTSNHNKLEKYKMWSIVNVVHKKFTRTNYPSLLLLLLVSSICFLRTWMYFFFSFWY